MNYVAHDCRNSRNPETIKVNNKYIKNPEFCNNRWIDKDVTGATTQIPTWKYCRECCEKLGIDFEKQKPSDYRSESENERLKQKMEKMAQIRKQNANSKHLSMG